jgi:hypothetical protein
LLFFFADNKEKVFPHDINVLVLGGGDFLFQSLEPAFQSLKCTSQSLQRTFQSLEWKISLKETTFSGERKEFFRSIRFCKLTKNDVLF